MKYKVLVSLKYNSTRFVQGDEIEMDEEKAESLVEKGLLGVIPEVSPKEEPKEEPQPEETPEVPDYSKRKGSDLRKIAEGRDIDTKGMKKNDLIEALESADEAAKTEEEDID